MDVRELRIGNYVHNNIESFAIQAKDLVFLLAFDNEHYAEPIPLTEEWLLNFRFKVDESIVVKTTLNTSNIHEFYYYNKINGDTFRKDVRYVHEYQNLYLSLTGQELTIK